jgi:hypothetical protein
MGNVLANITLRGVFRYRREEETRLQRLRQMPQTKIKLLSPRRLTAAGLEG